MYKSKISLLFDASSALNLLPFPRTKFTMSLNNPYSVSKNL